MNYQKCMRSFIAAVFGLLSILSTQSYSANSSLDKLGLKDNLANAQVVMVTWQHIDGNPAPRILAESLTAIESTADVTLVAGLLRSNSHANTNAGTLLVSAANKLNIPVLDGEPLAERELSEKIDAISNSEGTEQMKFNSIFGLSAVPPEDRAKNFSSVIDEQLAQGKKVVVLVGENLAPSIEAHLKSESVNVRSIRTNLDLANLEFSADGQVLELVQPTAEIKFFQSASRNDYAIDKIDRLIDRINTLPNPITGCVKIIRGYLTPEAR